MRCFSSKKSLILLSCVAAAIVLICGAMVVTAYISWKHKSETMDTEEFADARTPAGPPFSRNFNGQSSMAVHIDANGGSHGGGSDERAKLAADDLTKLRDCASRKWFESLKLQGGSSVTSPNFDKNGVVESSRSSPSNDDEDFTFSGSGQRSIDGDSEQAASLGTTSAIVQDACSRALQCSNDPFLAEYIRRLADLPSCPCFYPESAQRKQQPSHASSGAQDMLRDETSQEHVEWRDALLSAHYLSVYHSGAVRCIRSIVKTSTVGTTATAVAQSLAAQSCCYDAQSWLITRGPGAGTPQLVSPDVSPALHRVLDRLPWLLCRGDWTRYNQARPPNNGRGCQQVPGIVEYYYLALKAKDT